MATIELVVRDYSGLRAMRDALARLLTDLDIDRMTVVDVLVAASELVTNGLMHSHAHQVDVAATVDGRRISLAVTHAEGADDAPADQITQLDQGGRGLRIVDTLSSERAVEVIEGSRCTELQFDLPVAAPV